MKTATLKELKTELNNQSHSQILELCIQLTKFKKENKELLTYLLFEAENDAHFIEDIKTEIDQQLELINTNSYFYIKKSVRKILRNIKKYIKYSKKKETEVELILYFCKKLYYFKPAITGNNALNNIFLREISSIKKKIQLLHEDLQYDYTIELHKFKL